MCPEKIYSGVFMVRLKRTKIQKFLDEIFFPIRALFFPEHSGLFTSLGDERMLVVSELISSKVLDVGCGRNNIFVSNFTDPTSDS